MTSDHRRPARRLLVAVGLSSLIAVGPGVGHAVAGPDAPPPPTREAIKALLRTEITPSGPASELSVILRTGGYTLSFEALSGGIADVEWDVAPPGGQAHAAARTGTLVIARGSLVFAVAATADLRMVLTQTGRTLLRSERRSHVRNLSVRAKATFTPAGDRPISVAVTQAPASAGATPRCFGAASHDPRRRCVNPRLHSTVTPTPAEALITPNAPCRPVSLTGLVIPCVFGVPVVAATRQVALLGDSHAETWRGAITVVADRLGWSAVSLTRSSCSFSQTIPVLRPSLAASCLAWRAGVVDWFQANPNVSTVFVADNALAEAVGTPGTTSFANQVKGYRDAWRALPRSVTQIVVIRDSPFPGTATGPCVEAAITRHQVAAVTCARPRGLAVYRDPAASAAHADAPRASVVDLTGFFCGPRDCPPVIGGVLVYKDASHMSNLFSTTLGPFLLSRVRQLVRGPQ
ncbi:MAG: hypothetical protein QOH12_404 [Solirubrobacteraceae bacterium]|nr:hypothetical protein [Solirubrobacteraceae bacterium]